MKNDKLVPGMILVSIGAIFLLHNFGYLHFHWENFAVLWPLFIVVPGVLLLLGLSHSAWAAVLRGIIIVGAVLLLLFGDFGHGRFRWWPHWTYRYHSDDNNNYDDYSNDDDNGPDSAKVTKISGNMVFNEPYKPGIKLARLNISGGATTYRLNDTTNELFKADTREFRGRYDFKTHQEDSVYVIDFTMKHNKGIWNWGDGDDNHSNKADIMLNTNPEWEVNVDAGATDLNFDLSKYKLRSMNLKGGAGSFKVRIGQPLANTDITVSTGASDVTLEVPQNAACHIKSESGLSSTTYDGFNKLDDGDYETAGFNAAKNKIYIHIQGGISDFKVHKY